MRLEFECSVKEITRSEKTLKSKGDTDINKIVLEGEIAAFPCGASKHCGYGRCEVCGWESEDGALEPAICPVCGGRVKPFCGWCEGGW